MRTLVVEVLLVGRAWVLSASTIRWPAVSPETTWTVVEPVAPSCTWTVLLVLSAPSVVTVPAVSVVLVTAETGTTSAFSAEATVMDAAAVTPGASAGDGSGTVTTTG